MARKSVKWKPFASFWFKLKFDSLVQGGVVIIRRIIRYVQGRLVVQYIEKYGEKSNYVDESLSLFYGVKTSISMRLPQLALESNS